MKPALHQNLSMEDKQKALFKLLNKVGEELFDGTQKRLAACLHIDASTLSRWYKDGICKLNPDNRSNDYQVLIHLLAIYRSLTSIFSNPADRKAWFQANNNHLHGESPEGLLQSGIDGLLQVRQYLDFVRGQGA